MWKELLTALGGTAVVLAAIAFMLKSIINHYLSKDVEKYKCDLKHESDLKIEEFRVSLKMTAFEHEVRFSRLHDKRALVIAEMYEKLVGAINAVGDFASPAEFEGEPDKQEKWKVASGKYLEFYQYFNKRKIFLGESLCKQISEFSEKLYKPAYEYSIFITHPTLGEQLPGRKFEAWTNAWDSVSKDVIPRAREALEKEFRGILGANGYD